MPVPPSKIGRKTILILLPFAPYPLNASGLSLRYLPIIQFLSQRHTLDLMIVDTANPAPSAGLKPYCRNLFLVETSRWERAKWTEKMAAWIKILAPWGSPHEQTLYKEKAIGLQIETLAGPLAYDVFLSVGMGRNLPHLEKISAKRVVIDFVDSPTGFYAREVGGTKKSLFATYQKWKVKQYEIQAIKKSAATLYISPVDARTLPLHTTPGHPRYALPNGISCEGFSSALQAGIASPSIGFLGNMGYYPNIEAVHWLYNDIFLPLRARNPRLSLHIIGRSPADSVLSLGEKEGVVVTGEVAQVWPYLNAIDLFIAPLLRGTGVKNKILEILYAKKAILTTPLANEGIDAVHGRDLLLCNTAEEFQREANRLLQSPTERSRLGEAGHQWVTARFLWEPILRDFEGVLTGSPLPAHREVHPHG
jgi:glycosyltransferase involved in cell wall biosynthesis